MMVAQHHGSLVERRPPEALGAVKCTPLWQGKGKGGGGNDSSWNLPSSKFKDTMSGDMMVVQLGDLSRLMALEGVEIEG